jgi:acyl-CoA dehydrogenase
VKSSLVAAEELLPLLRRNAEAIDRGAEFPVESLTAMRASGLLGALVPVEYGGAGGGLADLVKVARVLASGCLSTALIWAMHCQQVDAIVRFATPALRSEILPEIAAGEVYLASVTTESGKGGHLLTGVAALHGDGETVTFYRKAPIVTGGHYADAFLITMRDSPEAPDHRVTLVCARRAQLDIETHGEWDPLGMRGTHSVGMRLTGTVSPKDVIGPPGEFRTVAVESMIPAGHLGWAACWLGTAHGALADVLRLLRSGDRPRGFDSRSELTSERIARARIDVELVDAYLHRVLAETSAYRTAGKSLSGPDTQIHLNNLKVVASELSFRAVDQLIQIVGLSNGYFRRSAVPLERHFRDLRSASLNYSNDRLLAVTGTLSLFDQAAHMPQGGMS